MFPPSDNISNFLYPWFINKYYNKIRACQNCTVCTVQLSLEQNLNFGAPRRHYRNPYGCFTRADEKLIKSGPERLERRKTRKKRMNKTYSVVWVHIQRMRRSWFSSVQLSTLTVVCSNPRVGFST